MIGRFLPPIVDQSKEPSLTAEQFEKLVLDKCDQEDCLENEEDSHENEGEDEAVDPMTDVPCEADDLAPAPATFSSDDADPLSDMVADTDAVDKGEDDDDNNDDSDENIV